MLGAGPNRFHGSRSEAPHSGGGPRRRGRLDGCGMRRRAGYDSRHGEPASVSESGAKTPLPSSPNRMMRRSFFVHHREPASVRRARCHRVQAPHGGGARAVPKQGTTNAFHVVHRAGLANDGTGRATCRTDARIRLIGRTALSRNGESIATCSVRRVARTARRPVPPTSSRRTVRKRPMYSSGWRVVWSCLSCCPEADRHNALSAKASHPAYLVLVRLKWRIGCKTMQEFAPCGSIRHHPARSERCSGGGADQT